MPRPNHAFVVALLLGTAACSPALPSDSQRPDFHSARLDVVTGADITATGGYSALDGIRLLRPSGSAGRSFTSVRNPGGEPPVVYLDGARMSDLASLQHVHPGEVESMEYLDASTATIRYGTGHTGGAYVVRTTAGGG